VLPYLKSKLHSIYNKEREARIQATLWGDENESYDFETSTLLARASITTRITKRFQKIVGLCYPLLHAGTEGFQFAYQMLYLLDATGYYSLALHALGIHVCRATGQELVNISVFNFNKSSLFSLLFTKYIAESMTRVGSFYLLCFAFQILVL